MPTQRTPRLALPYPSAGTDPVSEGDNILRELVDRLEVIVGPPTGSAGGDLGGTYPNPQVVTINGVAVSAVVFNNDTRLTDARIPKGPAGGDLGGTYPNPQVVTINGRAHTAVVFTDDPRLADARTPTDNSVTAAKVNSTLKPSAGAAAGTEALRALGTTAATAAAGNDSRIVNAVQPNTRPSLAGVVFSDGSRMLTFPAGWYWYITGNDIALIDSPAGGYASGYLAGHYSAWSDVSIKTNIEKLSDPVDKVMAVEGKRHEWKDTADGDPTFGFLAQDVEKFMPEVVGYDAEQELHHLDYMKMIPVVWEALKDAIGVIRDLRDRVTALERAAS